MNVPRELRRAGTLFAALAAALAITATAWTAGHVYRDLKPARRAVSSADRTSALNRLPGLEDVALRTRDGLTLAGWFAPGRLPTAVVFVHGLGANRMQLLPEAEIASRRGHGVLLYDSRASGASGGDMVTWGDRERLDVAAALDFLAARQTIDHARIAAYGFSVGATAVALTAADDARIAAVVLGPTWTSLSDELDAKFRKGRPLAPALAKCLFRMSGVALDAVRPVDVVARIAPRPLLLISGTDDDDTPPAVMDRLQAAAPFGRRWLVPGAGHGGYAKIAPAEMERRLGGFLDGALGTYLLHQ